MVYVAAMAMQYANDVAWRQQKDRIIILQNDSNDEQRKIHELTGAAGDVWKNCEDASAEEMATLLTQKYHVELDQALIDVHSFLDQLESLKLICHP